MEDVRHARLDQLARPSVGETAIDAARKVADAGGSPRPQIDAARQATGKKLSYIPHQGQKERLKRLARMEKAARDAA